MQQFSVLRGSCRPVWTVRSPSYTPSLVPAQLAALRHSQRTSKRSRIVVNSQRRDERAVAALQHLKSWWQQQQSNALYKYFRDFRKDSFSDLQAILLLAMAVNVSLAAFKVLFMGESSVQAWDDFYSAAVVTFGEAWPPTTAPVTEQVFSIGLYLTGLIGFAVLLALVEQTVLQVYENRVELGSPVLEQGHILVLCWCRSQADVSKLEIILRQLCAAYSCSGGRTLVVLSQRKKTEMEDLFAAAIPQQQRGGSRFVFRQGNPLTPPDLKLVAADDASVVMVLADSATTADVSDSQVLRVLVVLDELEAAARQEGRQRPNPGHVVAEVLSNDAMPLLKFMAVKPVLPLPSHRLNAMRIAELVTRPVVSHLTDTLWDFNNSSAVYMHSFPQLAGHTIADVALRFEEGIVLGLLEASTGFVLINPPAGYTLNAGEHIIMLRPTAVNECDIKPLAAPVAAPVGNYSPEAAAAAWQQSQQSLNMPMVISCGCPSDIDIETVQQTGETLAKDQQRDEQQQQQQQQQQQMASLKEQQLAPYRQLQQLLQEQQQHGDASMSMDFSATDFEAAIIGSHTLDNAAVGKRSRDRSGSEQSAASNRSTEGVITRANATAAAAPQRPAARSVGAVDSRSSSPGAAAGAASMANGGYSVASWDLDAGGPLPSNEVMDLLKGTRRGFNTCRMFSLAEASLQLSRHTPLNLLVLGWGEQEFMSQLLLALATGTTALPSGSRVTFANAHAAETTLAPALEAAGPPELLSGLSVSHLRLEPLARSQLNKLDLQRANAAIVLCDDSWRHQLAPQPSPFGTAAAAAPTHLHSAVYSSGYAGLSAIGSNSGSSFDAAAPASSSSSANLGSFSTAAAAAAGAHCSAGAAAGSSGGGVFSGGGLGADVLQLDALLLRVQLNLRSVLQGIGRETDVNIITEKVGTEQDTRFEDKTRLPLGVPVNLSSYTACMMSQLAYSPITILPRTLGAQIDPLIVDADLYTDVGDKVSFWQLMVRAQLQGHVLLGYYVLPVTASDPIEAVLNPPGASRYERRVWNTGDNRLKFVVLQDASAARQQGQKQQQERDEEASSLSVAGLAAARARAAAAAKAAADASAVYYPVDDDGGWQWWMMR